MRRFMQTFVLAPQAAKKYFVRNDIFRYQDEVFQDDETESENELPVECKMLKIKIGVVVVLFCFVFCCLFVYLLFLSCGPGGELS